MSRGSECTGRTKMHKLAPQGVTTFVSIAFDRRIILSIINYEDDDAEDFYQNTCWVSSHS